MERGRCHNGTNSQPWVVERGKIYTHTHVCNLCKTARVETLSHHCGDLPEVRDLTADRCSPGRGCGGGSRAGPTRAGEVAGGAASLRRIGRLPVSPAGSVPEPSAAGCASGTSGVEA